MPNQETGIVGILPPNSQVTTLAENMLFCEGPVWSKQEQGVIFSDTDADEHRFWSETTGLKTWRKPSYQPNGNVFDYLGNLLTCEHGSRAIAITKPTGARTILIDRFEGKRFNSPNDLEVKSDGTIWFTDPDYGLLDRPKELDFNGVYSFDPKTEQLKLITTDLIMPNGIAFAPDESKLYVADSAENHRQVHVFNFDAQGNIDSNSQILCEIEHKSWGIDGLDVDILGNLYAAGGDGVSIFSPQGDFLGKICMPQPITNIAFGHTDGQTLFMTSQYALYSIRLLLPGAVKRW